MFVEILIPIWDPHLFRPALYLLRLSQLLLVGLPLSLALSGDPHLSVTTFASLENFNFSSIVACDIPFGEVCEAFSPV